MSDAPVYLVTGFTGFLAQEFVREAAAAHPEAEFHCVIRSAKAEGGPQQRLNKAITDAELESAASRIHAVEGDIRRPRFGMDDRAADELTAKVNRILHSAADVGLTRLLPQLRKVNVEGTRNALDLAEECRKRNPGFAHLSYASTAYVGGANPGVSREDVLTEEFGFKNNYERSKFEAESLVRERWGDLPTIIFRPSIIIWRSGDGMAKANNVLYPVIVAFLRKHQKWVPMNKRAYIDLVPVDYVAKAMLHIAAQPSSLGRCFHAAAGTRNDMTLGECFAIWNRALKTDSRIVPHWIYTRLIEPIRRRRATPEGRRMLQFADAYFPYLVRNPRFDCSNMHAALEGSGIEYPPFAKIAEEGLTFALEKGMQPGSVQRHK